MPERPPSPGPGASPGPGLSREGAEKALHVLHAAFGGQRAWTAREFSQVLASSEALREALDLDLPAPLARHAGADALASLLGHEAETAYGALRVVRVEGRRFRVTLEAGVGGNCGDAA